MYNKLTKLLFHFVVWQTAAKFVAVECLNVNNNRKGGGGRLLAAGLAGGLLGHALSKDANPKEIHHRHYIEENAPNATAAAAIIPEQPKLNTTIEKGEIQPHGCYKQTIKQPDQNDSSRYTETEQLICPHVLPSVTIQQPESLVPTIHTIQIPIIIMPAESKQQMAANPEIINTADNLTSTASAWAPMQSSTSPFLAVSNNQSTPLVAIPTDPLQITVLSTTTSPSDDGDTNAGNILLTTTLYILLCTFVITTYFQYN